MRAIPGRRTRHRASGDPDRGRSCGWDIAATLLPVDAPDSIASESTTSSLRQTGRESPWSLIQERFEHESLAQWLMFPAGQLVDGHLRLWVTDHGRIALSMPGLERRLLSTADLERLRSTLEEIEPECL